MVHRGNVWQRIIINNRLKGERSGSVFSRRIWLRLGRDGTGVGLGMASLQAHVAHG